MSQELTKELMCIALRNNVEIWLEKERAENLMQALDNKKDKGFVRIDNQFINIADVIGIFNAETMEEVTRRKNGQWKCDVANYWHNKGEICAHRSKDKIQ